MRDHTDFAEIAAALGVSLQAVKKRAAKESWPFTEQPVRGGKKRLFPLTTLPAYLRETLISKRLHHDLSSSAGDSSPPAVGLPAGLSRPAESLAGGVVPSLSAAAGLSLSGVCVKRGQRRAPVAEIAKTDADRAYQHAALVLCRKVDDVMALSGRSAKPAIAILARQLVAGEAAAELIEAAAATYLKRRAGPCPLGGEQAQLARLQKMYAFYQAGCLAGDPGLYLTPGRKPKMGHQVAHVAAFLRFYCRPTRPRVREAFDGMRDFLAAQGMTVPSYGTVCRIERELPVTIKYRGRVTGSEWRGLKPYIDRDVSMFSANDIWVGDGHSFKAKVQHPVHGQPFVPEVTVIIDWVSRKAVGWSVDLSESTVAVSAAFRHSQTQTRARPLVYYSDNGSGQTGKKIDHPITGHLARQGIAHETGRPGNPQGRGVIERLWQSTLIPLARTYPTCTWAGADKESVRKMLKALGRADDSGEKLLPSWRQFLDDVEACLARYNLEHAHRELDGRCPEAVYQERLDRDSIVFGPQDTEIAALWMPEIVRSPDRGLVRLFNNHYYRPELLDELAEKETVRARYDIHDAGRVWLYRMDGRFIGEALWDGNKVAAFPVPEIERLRGERAARKVQRSQEIIDEAQAELGNIYEGQAIVPVLFEPAPAPLVPPAPLEITDARPLPELPENAAFLPGIEPRPAFHSDPEQYRWLLKHPAQWDMEDARWLADYTTSDDYRDLQQRYEFLGEAWSAGNEERLKDFEAAAR